jgi:hypothetical protein
MRIQELFDEEALPEDLQWVVAEWKLHPSDPVFALIAWHWHRMQQGEDTLRGATMELKSAVDRRIEQVIGATETAVALHEQLQQVHVALKAEPLELSQRIEADLGRVLSHSVEQIHQLETTLSNMTQQAEGLLRRAQRRQAAASFLIGVTVGGIIVLWFG